MSTGGPSLLSIATLPLSKQRIQPLPSQYPPISEQPDSIPHPGLQAPGCTSEHTEVNTNLKHLKKPLLDAVSLLDQTAHPLDLSDDKSCSSEQQGPTLQCPPTFPATSWSPLKQTSHEAELLISLPQCSTRCEQQQSSDLQPVSGSASSLLLAGLKNTRVATTAVETGHSQTLILSSKSPWSHVLLGKPSMELSVAQNLASRVRKRNMEINAKGCMQSLIHAEAKVCATFTATFTLFCPSHCCQDCLVLPARTAPGTQSH